MGGILGVDTHFLRAYIKNVPKIRDKKARNDAPEPESDSTPAKTESIPKLTLPLVEDGSAIDWARVRGSNKNKFVGLIGNDPVARSVIAPTGPDGSEPEVDTFGGITEANVRAALDI